MPKQPNLTSVSQRSPYKTGHVQIKLQTLIGAFKGLYKSGSSYNSRPSLQPSLFFNQITSTFLLKLAFTFNNFSYQSQLSNLHQKPSWLRIAPPSRTKNRRCLLTRLPTLLHSSWRPATLRVACLLTTPASSSLRMRRRLANPASFRVIRHRVTPAYLPTTWRLTTPASLQLM